MSIYWFRISPALCPRVFAVVSTFPRHFTNKPRDYYIYPGGPCGMSGLILIYPDGLKILAGKRSEAIALSSRRENTILPSSFLLWPSRITLSCCSVYIERSQFCIFFDVGLPSVENKKKNSARKSNSIIWLFMIQKTHIRRLEALK